MLERFYSKKLIEGDCKMTLEVLLATMYQKDAKFLENMNIGSDIVVANQSDETSFKQFDWKGNRVKMLSTETRGISINRNLGFMLSTADILLIADDDVVYEDDYKEQVLKAFQSLPKADVVVFGMRYVRNGDTFKIIKRSQKRLRFRFRSSVNSVSIAVRRSSVLRKNIHFSTILGAGSLYLGGEDSLFFSDCLRRGLRAYTHPYILGETKRDTSTHFQGYTKRFFFDRGAIYRHAFPKMYILCILYLAWRLHHVEEIRLKSKIILMLSGARKFHGLTTYDNYIEHNSEEGNKTDGQQAT